MITSLEQLLAVPPTMEQVYIDTLKDSVYLRVMSGTAQDQYEEMVIDARSMEGVPGQSPEPRLWISQFRRRFAALVWCDETGALLARTPEQIEALGALDGPILDEIVLHGKRINGMGPSDVVLEAVEKNLPAALSGVSGSD